MITLAIDSTAKAASAALLSDNTVIAEYTQNTGHTHSETMLPMAEAVMKAAGVTPDAIDLFAISAGPGSFTGVRIGISLIKGLCFGKNKPIAALSSMDTLARNLEGFRGIVCPVMDARRNQVYTAIFKDGERITEDMLIPCSELKEMLSEYDCPIYFTGDGYDLARKLIDLPAIKDTPVRLRLQNAVSVALEGIKCYNENKNIFTDTEVMPIYLRASQAERERL
ncbi:MAG: tRNA (adenosine(37)-N6)-threonylcarbamoyltransferase complex dimerization subunit type 1 TsaB, partial [Clostridia bacterium]|nr:tRNA (adenosine(37)-N6)-threonylcarbamoyltransferase complex dimerization subunit type 1 TsaB [Clostridia bacterium]